jgi:hypothetical protein
MNNKEYNSTNIDISNNNKVSNKIDGSLYRWKVVEARSIPIFPLERGTKLIYKHASTVSNRIDEFLRTTSVQASFDSEKSVVDCKTANGLLYKITLYAGPENNDGDSTYVEMIRIKGCGFAFNKEKKAIISAVSDESEAKQVQPRMQNTTMNTMNTMKISKDLLDSYVPPSIEDLEIILEQATDQFHSMKKTIILFTLQNLVSMTTQDVLYRTRTPYDLSNLIMAQNYNNLRDIIVTIYKDALKISNPTTLHGEDEINEKIRHACLCIVLNGLQSIYDYEYESRGDTIFDYQDVLENGTEFIDQLVPSLVETVKRYNEDVHNAHLAMSCLCTLIEHSPKATCDKLQKINIYNALECAKSYGEREHLKLEMEANRTMKVLRQSQYITTV